MGGCNGIYSSSRQSVRPALYKKYALGYNAFGDGFYNLFTGYTWLRSGDKDDSPHRSNYMTCADKRFFTFSATELAVRPALYNNRNYGIRKVH